MHPPPKKIKHGSFLDWENKHKKINAKSSLSNILFQAPQFHFYPRIRPTVQKFLAVKQRPDIQDAELMVIPLKICTWFSYLTWHVCMCTWHLDKFMQTSDSKYCDIQFWWHYHTCSKHLAIVSIVKPLDWQASVTFSADSEHWNEMVMNVNFMYAYLQDTINF